MLVKPTRKHRDDAHLWTGRTFALVGAHTLGIERVPDVHRMREFDVVPAEVGNSVLAHIEHCHTKDHSDSQTGIDDDAPTRNRVRLGEMCVEVILIGVARQLGEPGRVSI